jgi:hypothetical protein
VSKVFRVQVSKACRVVKDFRVQAFRVYRDFKAQVSKVFRV